MGREALLPARTADRAHVGVALVDLDDAAAAPAGAAVVPEQPETLRFLRLA
jgi:hypothetical protein